MKICTEQLGCYLSYRRDHLRDDIEHDIERSKVQSRGEYHRHDLLANFSSRTIIRTKSYQSSTFLKTHLAEVH